MARLSTSSAGSRNSSNSGSNPHLPSPGSPTLTNPDMILPDYHDADVSPPRRSQYTSSSWKDSQVSDMQYKMAPQPSARDRPKSPTTPIMYGNGTMLSDIGEVTEVESNAGAGKDLTYSNYSRQSDRDLTLRSSPTIGKPESRRTTAGPRPMQRLPTERRLSSDSCDTITEQEPSNHFNGFDDLASVGDSNFQGDDEESIASSYADHATIHIAKDTALGSLYSAGGEGYSTNSLSRRAEEILANAKRRLTTMEGNLSRARSSLMTYSISDGSTPSPPVSRPSTALRELTLPTHVRNSSDFGTAGGQGATPLRRSSSALGAAGGYRQPHAAPRTVGPLDSSTRTPTYRVSHQPLNTTFESLLEDDETESRSNKRGSSQSANIITLGSQSYLDTGTQRPSSVVQVRDLQDQMNGLKGKISSLKEQALADSLKRRSLQSMRTPSPFTHARFENGLIGNKESRTEDQQAQTSAYQAPQESSEMIKTITTILPVLLASEDNKHRSTGQDQSDGMMREEPEEDPPRRSLDEQSVMTKFDEAFEELPQDLNNDDIRRFGSSEDKILQQGHEERTLLVQGSLDHPADEVITDEKIGEEELGHSNAGAQRDGDENETEGDGDDARSDAGMSTYHDTYQSLSHEDREDAFDYEHFFLHSAMGTLSRQNRDRRDSWGSGSSEGSVETTRGPALAHGRRPSVDTMSSVNTFATAQEGRSSRSSSHWRKDSRDSQKSKDEALDHFEEVMPGMNSFGRDMKDWQERRNQQNAVAHRPSISSFDSSGTNRSFPLVNKAKINGLGTVLGASSDREAKQSTDSLLLAAPNDSRSRSTTPSLQMAGLENLPEEDKRSVRILMENLDVCLQGAAEAAGTPAEAKAYRQRIDDARRILDGRFTYDVRWS